MIRLKYWVYFKPVILYVLSPLAYTVVNSLCWVCITFRICYEDSNDRFLPCYSNFWQVFLFLKRHTRQSCHSCYRRWYRSNQDSEESFVISTSSKLPGISGGKSAPRQQCSGRHCLSALIRCYRPTPSFVFGWNILFFPSYLCHRWSLTLLGDGTHYKLLLILINVLFETTFWAVTAFLHARP